MELMRRLVFVGAEYEGFIYPNPSAPHTNPIIVRDLTDQFVSFADSEISVERDGLTGTMTKIAYSLKFAKNEQTLFLKECYERFITKGRSNYPRQSYELMFVDWIGTQSEFDTLTANDYKENDVAWVVDGRLMKCKVDENTGNNYWEVVSPPSESVGYVNPKTIVYCVDIINNRGHEKEFCAYINITDERVSMDKLKFWSWTETAPIADRVYMHEHDYFSAPDDGNDLLRGADLAGAMPLDGTIGDRELQNIEDLMSNSEYKRLNSEVKLMIGFATDESAERPNLAAYRTLSDFASANKGEFIRLFTVNINWESYKETRDYIEFEAANPSLQSLLKSEGDTQFDIDLNSLDPQFVAIDKPIEIPLYGDHTFPVYDPEHDEGVRQSIMSTTDMEQLSAYYFPNVSFGDITGLDNGILQPLTFGDQTGYDVWSRIRNRPEQEYLLKNTKDYAISVRIRIPYFKCHVNYRKYDHGDGQKARVLLLKGRHDAGDDIDSRGTTSYYPLKYYAANINGNPSDGAQAYTDMRTGDYWYDTDNNIVRVYNEGLSDWENVCVVGNDVVVGMKFFSNSTIGDQPPAKPNEPRDTDPASPDYDGNDYILYEWDGTTLKKTDSVDSMAGLDNGNYEILHEWFVVPGTTGKSGKYYHADLETSQNGEDVIITETLMPHEEVCFCVKMRRVNFNANESYSSHFYVYASSEGITEEDTVGDYPKMLTYLSSSHKAKKEDRYHGSIAGIDTAVVKGCAPIKAVEFIVSDWVSKFNGAYKVKFHESLNDVVVREFSFNSPRINELNWDNVSKRMYYKDGQGKETDVTPLENSNVYYYDKNYSAYPFEYVDGDMIKVTEAARVNEIMPAAAHPYLNFVGEEVMYSGYHRIKDGFSEQNLGVVPLLIPVESLNGKSDPKLHVNMKELLKWFKISGYEYSIETDGETGADTLVIAPREYFFDYRCCPIRPRKDLWSNPYDRGLNSRFVDGWEGYDKDPYDYQGKIPVEENTTIGRDYAVTNGEYNREDSQDPDNFTWKRPEIHERGEVTLQTNKSFCYNEIVVGYDKEDYENLVGTNDPVSTCRYSTGYVTADEKKTLEMSTKIRMDFYGMMYWLIRSYTEDYDKSSDKVFCLDCQRMPSIQVKKTGNDYYEAKKCSLRIWDKIVVDANIVQDDYTSHTTYYNALRTPYMLMKLMNRRMGLVFANELTFMKSDNFTPSTGAGAYVRFKCNENEPISSPYRRLLDGMKNDVTATINLRMCEGVADYCPPLFTLGTATVKVGATRMLWANLNVDEYSYSSGDNDYVLSLLEKPNEMLRFVDDDDVVRYGFINKHSFHIYNYKEGEIELLLSYPRRKVDDEALTMKLIIPPTNKEEI